MYNMKEIKNVIVRNNNLNQFTTYNFPLLTKITEKEKTAIRAYE